MPQVGLQPPLNPFHVSRVLRPMRACKFRMGMRRRRPKTRLCFRRLDKGRLLSPPCNSYRILPCNRSSRRSSVSLADAMRRQTAILTAPLSRTCSDGHYQHGFRCPVCSLLLLAQGYLRYRDQTQRDRPSLRIQGILLDRIRRLYPPAPTTSTRCPQALQRAQPVLGRLVRFAVGHERPGQAGTRMGGRWRDEKDVGFNDPVDDHLYSWRSGMGVSIKRFRFR